MPLFKKGDPRPPNAGRKKGTPNKATIKRRLAEAEGLQAQYAAIESTEMPLDYLLRKMRNPAEAPADRFLAARAAAPYCHPQLQAVAHKHLDAHGNALAPVINVTIEKDAPAAPVEAPRLTHQGPKAGESVQ